LGNGAFEKFSLYGFAISYPLTCRIEFNPKTRRESGDVVFHFPDLEKVYLSWGELEKVQKKFPTVDEHAEHSIEIIKKNRGVKNLERISKDSINLNSHTAVYTHIRLSEIQASMFVRSRETRREAYSIHLHCSNAGRYFVLYSLIPETAGKEFEGIFRAMANTFECHP
jgi:hypothetical protein